MIMADNARGGHVSPNIYTREIEANYSVKSIGTTSLGLVGETVKGPAFQVMDIANWREFQDVFGGTSTEKFIGSQYPKYELPYIAKSFLTESENLKVVRILGLSGYNAGPAWVITVSNSVSNSASTNDGDNERYVVAVIRSRGHYNYYNASDNNSCQCDKTKFDVLEYEVGEKKEQIEQSGSVCKFLEYNMNALQIKGYVPFKSIGNQCEKYTTESGSPTWSVSQTNKGRFKLVGVKGKKDIEEIQGIIDSADVKNGYFEYAVSLNPNDSDYILKVLGTSSSDGGTPIYVETLYDVALEQAITSLDVNIIDSGLTIFNAYKTVDYCQHAPIDGIVEMQQYALSRKMLGMRFLADKNAINSDVSCVVYDYKTNKPMLIRDYYEDVEKRKLIKNERPNDDFFIFEYRAPGSGNTLPGRVTDEDGNVYNKKNWYHTLPIDLESYQVTFSKTSATVETTESGSTPLNASNFRWTISNGTSEMQTPSVNFDETKEIKPNYINNNSLSGVSSYTYYFVSSTATYHKDFSYPSSALFSMLKADATLNSKAYSSNASLSKTAIFSSSTYSYGSQAKEVIDITNAENVGGPTPTPIYIKWSSQYADLDMQVGQIYTVKDFIGIDGEKKYIYVFYDADDVSSSTTRSDGDNLINIYGNLLNGGTSGNTEDGSTLVLNKSNGLYYKMNSEIGNVEFVDIDLNDYMSSYRYASTPWIVSNVKGDYNNMEVNKLFRFHTISDGDNSNREVKISIENIRPDDGTFDVVVRRIDDLDESIIPLEKFSKCTMIPSDPNYIGYKIGSFDGTYEPKSKYITVEVNETTAAKTSVPAGFLGYPIPCYSGCAISDDSQDYGDGCANISGRTNLKFPTIKYNRDLIEDVKNKRQYFGLSSWVGVDIDNFTFKGTKNYINDPKYLSNGFHLDSRLDSYNRSSGDSEYVVSVDGKLDYKFDAVTTNARTQILDNPPIIGKEEDMYGSIYEDVSLRKFTVFFYGGFDGWDVYRSQRSNGDNFKITQYKGYIDQASGEGYSFKKINNPEVFGLNQKAMTSDWYAYLAAIRKFSNKEETNINVFATPGIDYVSQKLLVEETIDMIEEERADSIYITTTPDKPNGASDYVDEMYTPEDVVYLLEDTEIDSNYTCTYYPWVKYLDVENNQYIYLPPTKDVARNFAQTDNQTQAWFAPAGIERGSVDCVKAHFITSIADEDVLYGGRINPVKTFAQNGVKIWGQKNLQINESQLDRIAVRRLLLRMKKLVSLACIGLIFEQNDGTAKQTFISRVAPILDSIRSNRGISDYRIEVDDTPESRERRELPCKIFFKPYNALEYITIDFVLTPEGVSFSDL